jgi:hypothetical protein
MPQEPETVRVVTVYAPDEKPCGAGCLVSSSTILTCAHVVESALGKRDGEGAPPGAQIRVLLGGVKTQPVLSVSVERMAPNRAEADDLALLRISPHDAEHLSIRPVEFAAPMVHGGKTFAVMGFPQGREYGLHAGGRLRAADLSGLVQMDEHQTIAVQPGFSGAPVWCPDLRAFVGIVIAGRTDVKIAWLIPSRILAHFLPDLAVKFRIPPADRPIINDQREDDPNLDLFGLLSTAYGRRLRAKVQVLTEGGYCVNVRYECLPGSAPPRGQWVTFITYPDFREDKEDAYELYGQVKRGIARQTFYPLELFTVAAIGDAGDTALTLNLSKLRKHRS